MMKGFKKERRRHTLPQIAVPSAQAGLTTLFGMGRGEPRRNNHLKRLQLLWAIIPELIINYKLLIINWIIS